MSKNSRKADGSRLRGTRTVVRDGRVVVEHNGETVPQAVYCDYILRGDWEDRVREFTASGVRVFHLKVPHGALIGAEDYYDTVFWPADGVYADDVPERRLSLDYQAKTILATCPEARFYIKFLTTPPLDWRKRHPGELQTDEDGRVHREASLSSTLLLRDIQAYLGKLVSYCEGRSWGDRIVGYLGMPCGEGIMPLNIAGKMFDRSPANRRAFRGWLKSRYGRVSALRKAWGDARVSFSSARVPCDRDWLRKRAQGPATIGGKPVDLVSLPSNCQEADVALFHWVEAGNAAPERGYCLFMRDAFIGWTRTVVRAVKGAARECGRERLVGLDTVKQHQIGWQIQSSFDGIGDGQSFPSMFVFTGSTDVGVLLDEDGFDAVWNPADYFARSLGFAFESEGLIESMTLRGKVAFVENDSRTFVGQGIEDQGAFRNQKEVEAGLLRNAALPISRGQQDYWCNVGSSYFHDAGIQRTVARITRMLDRVQKHPHRETRDAVAFVVDDAGPLYEDFTSGFQTLALTMQRVGGLAHCGLPYRIVLLSDLAKDAVPDYRTWVFPNLFRVDDGVWRLLRRRVMRDGNVAVFGPATGITDGTHLGAQGASRLLGVRMELFPRTTVRHVVVRDCGHRVSRELPANLVFGDSLPYGPTIVPADGALDNGNASELGRANTCWYINRPGLFCRDFGKGASGNGRSGPRGKGDWAAVWSVALPLPAPVLRACARYAGANVWCEEDDVVYASDSFVALHSTKKGPREIRLPRPCRVRDALTGRPVGAGRIRSIKLRVDPPQTRAFLLE